MLPPSDCIAQIDVHSLDFFVNCGCGYPLRLSQLFRQTNSWWTNLRPFNCLTVHRTISRPVVLPRFQLLLSPFIFLRLNLNLTCLEDKHTFCSHFHLPPFIYFDIPSRVRRTLCSQPRCDTARDFTTIACIAQTAVHYMNFTLRCEHPSFCISLRISVATVTTIPWD